MKRPTNWPLFQKRLRVIMWKGVNIFYLHDAKCIRVRFRIDLGNFGWSSETALGHLLNSARNRHHDFSLSENLNSCFWAVLQILGVISPQAQFSKAPGLYKERSEDQNDSEQKNRLSDKNKGRDLDKEQAWISSDSEFSLNHLKINNCLKIIKRNIFS